MTNPGLSSGVSARSRLGLVLLGVAPFVLLALRHWSYGPDPVVTDHSQYLLHTKALLEGRPYTHIGIIRTPLAGWVGVPYPPGLPLMLLPIAAVFGFAATPIKLAVLLSGAVFVAAAGLYFAREHWKLGLGVALLAGLSTGMLHSATVPLSDLPFAACVWITILLVDREGAWTPGRIVAVTLVGAAALSFRAAGVALLPALVLYGLAHWRRVGLRSSIPVLAWVAGMVGASLLFFPVRNLGHMVPNLRWELAWRVIRRVPDLRLPLSESLLYPFPWGAANAAYQIVGAGLVALGLFMFVRRTGPRFVTLFAGSYVAMVLLAPVPTGTRYLWPLFPLLVYGLLHGIEVVVGWVRTLSRRVASRTAALGVAGLLVAGVSLRHAGAEAVDEALARDMHDVFTRVRALAAADTVRVVFPKPRVLTWETGVPAMAVIRGYPHEILFELCDRGITHVALPAAPAPITALPDWISVRHLVEREPAWFTFLARNGHFVLYTFARDACTSAVRDPSLPSREHQ